MFLCYPLGFINSIIELMMQLLDFPQLLFSATGHFFSVVIFSISCVPLCDLLKEAVISLRG